MKKVLKTLATGALLASLATVAACGQKTETPQPSTPTSAPTTVVSTTTVAPSTTTSTPAPSTTTSTTTTTPAPAFKYVKGNGAGKNVNVGVNYISSGYHYGVTFQETTPEKNLDGQDMTKDSLLPYWQAIQSELNLTVTDTADYDQTSIGNEWQKYIDDGAFNYAGRNIDLIMADGTKSVTAGNKGMLMSISDLVDQGKLPNFANWVSTHQSVWNSMKAADGKVYYTPYFDGFDNVEKMFLMDRAKVEALLDAENPAFDTSAVVTTHYAPQVPSMDSEKIDTLVAGKKKTITVSFGANQNIIAKQNALATKNGATLTKTLRQYLEEVYGDYIGEGKPFAKLSDIFLSEGAVYNADELVALMRCAKANPVYLTGTDKIEVMIPRTGEANRQRQIFEFSQIWGIRGTSSEKDRLYFDKDGDLQDGRTNIATYDGLDNLNNLYKEGLFPEDYYKGYGLAGYKSEWRKNLMKTGQVFMLYDYNGTSNAYNNDANSDYKAQMEAILPPVAKWDAGVSRQQNYFHFTEDTRQLKAGGWAIPATANTEALDAICAIIDYAFMPEGADLQDFGPNTTTYRAAVTQYDENGYRIAGAGTFELNGVNEVKFSDNVLNNAGFKSGWNNWCRKYIGTTQGVGHVRSDALDYQATISAQARGGLDKLSKAMLAGTFVVAKSTGSKFFQAVPTTYAITAQDDANITASAEAQKMMEFWKESNPKATTESLPSGYTLWVCEGRAGSQVVAKIGSYEEFVASFDAVNAVYRTAYRAALA